MRIHNYEVNGVKSQCIEGDTGNAYEIVTGKIVPKLATTLKKEALEVCLENRKSAYAKLNQDELRFDDMMNRTTTWKDTILAIKAKYPKPI